MLKLAVKAILVLCLSFILIAGILRNVLCKLALREITSAYTGLNLDIKELNLNLFKSSLSLRRITLHNPAGFPNDTLAKIEEIFIQYNLSGLLKKRLHLRFAKIAVAEINIARNEEGTLNTASFRKARQKARPPQPQMPDDTSGATEITKQPAKQKKEQRPAQFFIDRLEVYIGKATYMDYQAGIGQPAVIIYTSKGAQVFENVSNLDDVVSSISRQGNLRNLINKLLGMRPQDLLNAAGETVKKMEAILPQKEKAQ